MSHTSGPWHVSQFDRRTIGPRRVLHAHGTDVPQLQAVARVLERTGETHANALLIAAAPELLEACREWMAWYARQPDHENVVALTERMRVAIAKADGLTESV